MKDFGNCALASHPVAIKGGLNAIITFVFCVSVVLSGTGRFSIPKCFESYHNGSFYYF
jgi:hypothetical protein